MSDDNAAVDTNVLIYALDPECEHFAAARALFDQVQRGTVTLCLTPQVLLEFFAVVTDDRRVKTPRRPAEALDVIDKYLAMPGIVLLPVPHDVVRRWVDQARQHPVTRGRIFDLQLIATILGNGVRRIYTFNRNDFDKFPEVEVLVPTVAPSA